MSPNKSEYNKMIVKNDDCHLNLKSTKRKKLKFRPLDMHDFQTEIMPKNDENKTVDSVDSVPHHNSDPGSKLIDAFKTARELLKKPVDLSNLTEVQSRCKTLIEKLGNTLKTIEKIENCSRKMESDHSSGDVNNLIEKSNASKVKHRGKHKCLSENPVIEETTIIKKKCILKSPDDDQIIIESENQSISSSSNDNVVEISDEEDSKDLVQEVTLIDDKKSDKLSEESYKSFLSFFFPLTSNNSWELLQLRKMLDDPFLSATRKEYLNNRILELNDKVIQDLLTNSGQCNKNGDIIVLEKLCLMSTDNRLLPNQQQQIECVLVAFKEKVLSDVMKIASNVDVDYQKTVDSLQVLLRLPCFSQDDKETILSKVMDLRAKTVNGLIKRTHSPMEDSIRLLEKVRNIMNDPFLPEESKSKLLHKVKYLRNKTASELTKYSSMDLEDDAETLEKLKFMIQDTTLSYTKRLKMVNKIKSYEEAASKVLRSSKSELKKTFMTSLEEVLDFEGTNLNNIVGYGVDPEYVRCINIWTLQKS